MIRDVGLTLVKLVQEQKPDLVCCTFSTIYCGIHIKEKFNIPCAILSYVPIGPTKYFFSSYAHKFFQASAVKPAQRNLMSHQIIDYMYGKLTQPMMGQFRKEIGLPNIDGFARWKALKEAPVLTCYSPAFMPPPPDWPTTHRQVGYWWLPPTDMTTLDTRTRNTITAVDRFIAAGNGELPVYIGFGSVPLSDPGQVERITKAVLDAVRLSGRRAIIATGWGAIELPSTIDTAAGQQRWLSAPATGSERAVTQKPVSEAKTDADTDTEETGDDESETQTDVPVSPKRDTNEANLPGAHFKVPENCFVLDAIPHDYLFRAEKLEVIVHHGGAGTTGAALRAGVPSVFVPFFGDHYLWSHRLMEIGAGPKSLSHEKLTADRLATRINQTFGNQKMKAVCKAIADKIAAEDGLADGVRAFEELVANGGKWSTSPSSSLLKPGLHSASDSDYMYRNATAVPNASTSRPVAVTEA